MSDSDPQRPIRETARQARQGPLGWPVWVVLAVSLTLAVIAYAIIYFWFADPSLP